ncbi:MAG: TrbI/VirB10 family protein [Bryobacteraceae bacterium]
MDNQEQPREVPPLPEPDKLPSGNLSTKNKRYIFLGIMGVLALVVLGNLFNSPTAPKAPKPDANAKTQQLNPTPSQVKEWADNLANNQAQLKAEAAQAEALAKAAHVEATPNGDYLPTQAGQNPSQGPSAQPSEEEQQRKQLRLEREALAYKSLFADNMVHQDLVGQGAAKPTAAVGDSADQTIDRPPASPTQASNAGQVPTIGTAPEAPASSELKTVADTTPAANKRKALDFDPAKQPTFWLPEGTVIEGVLTNKLDGSNTGPVNVMISAAVYLPGTRLLLLPQGTRVLGEASKVSSFGQGRLAVAFHRILVPGLNTYSIPLDKLPPGLAQAGEVGLKGKVNSHYASIFGASLAVGAIGGLAQIGNGTNGFGINPMSEFRNGVSQSTAQSADRILDRFLNRLPDIQISEGTRVRVLLTDDLQLPSYEAMHVSGPGLTRGF